MRSTGLHTIGALAVMLFAIPTPGRALESPGDTRPTGGLVVPPAALTRAQLTERNQPSPLLSIPTGERQAVDIDRPFWLRNEDVSVDGQADLLHRTSLRLAEVSILRVADRSVKARFTLAGHEPPRFRAPLPCLPAQALLSVKVDVISRPIK